MTEFFLWYSIIVIAIVIFQIIWAVNMYKYSQQIKNTNYAILEHLKEINLKMDNLRINSQFKNN